MAFSDSFFNKVESKTKINKNTILSLANKIQGNMKDETKLRELIQEIGSLTNKSVSKTQEDKIISTILNDKVPKNIDKMI